MKMHPQNEPIAGVSYMACYNGTKTHNSELTEDTLNKVVIEYKYRWTVLLIKREVLV